MMPGFVVTPGCVALCAVAALATAVGAAPLAAATPNSEAAPQQHAAQDLSREQAVAIVQKRYGARVVRTDFIDQDGRHLYVFRLLSTDGKVWIVRLDARTGTEVP